MTTTAITRTVTINVRPLGTDTIYGNLYSAWTVNGWGEYTACATREQLDKFIETTSKHYTDGKWSTSAGEPVHNIVTVNYQ